MNSPFWTQHPDCPWGTSVLRSRFVCYAWGGPHTQFHTGHRIQAWQPAQSGPLGTPGQGAPALGADISAHSWSNEVDPEGPRLPPGRGGPPSGLLLRQEASLPREGRGREQHSKAGRNRLGSLDQALPDACTTPGVGVYTSPFGFHLLKLGFLSLKL